MMYAQPLWMRLVRAYELRPEPSRGLAFAARHDGVVLRFVVEPIDATTAAVAIEVEPSAGPSLMILDRRLAPTDDDRLVSGDADLDRNVFIAATDPDALGLLDAPTRAALVAFVAAGGVYAAGALRLGPAFVAQAPRLDDVIRLMLALAARLSLPVARWRDELTRIATSDPNGAVRMWVQATRADRVPQAAPDPRIIAMRRLVALLEPDAPDDTFTGALRELARLGAPLRECLRAMSPGARGRAVSEAPAALLEDARHGDLLVALFQQVEPRSFALRREYLAALEELGDPRHAAAVADDLESADDETRLAAVAALEAIGDAASLPLLEPLTKGFTRSGRMKAAARAAVAAIRARTTDVHVGAMALADDRRGDLALKDAE